MNYLIDPVTPEQIAENRRKGVEALRTTTAPWGEGEFYNAATGCYCALGILARAIGLPLNGANEPWSEVEAAYGLSYAANGPVQSRHIYIMSDGNAEGHMSFREIGDVLATAWGIA